MKQLLWFLAVLGLTASVASAGPNAGGVLWVHDTGLVWTSSLVPPIVSTPPAAWTGVDTEQPADGVRRVWKVYAAFPPASSPRLKGTAWRTEFPGTPDDPGVVIFEAGCGPPDADGAGTDFSIEELGFPATSGGQIGQSFPFARTTKVVELYYFTGYAYASPTNVALPDSFKTVPHTNPQNQVFLDDAQPQNVDAIVKYGSLGFGGPGYAPVPTSDPDAACCAPAGTCTVTKQAACPAGSVWRGVIGTGGEPTAYVCLPNPCPPPTGGCCYSDGRCQVTLRQPCLDGGGAYQGNFVVCDPNPCPTPAACCWPSGACLLRTRTACTNLNPPGTWYSEFTTCSPNSCPPPPQGACCVSVGTCTVTSEANCPSPRIWHDAWEVCMPNPCPQPVFACCNVVDGTCVDTTLAACVAPIRVWHENQTCATYACPAAAPTGACCHPDGTCAVVANVLCPASGANAGTWHADWSSCDPNECPQPQGTCCDPLRGGCAVAAEAGCLPPGVWQLVPNSCDPNPCPQPPRGVCCSFPQHCAAGIYEVDCVNVGDVWHPEWTACLPRNPCPEPSPRGGCCTPHGECTITLPAACVEPSVWNIGWLGLEDGTCTPNACPQPPEGACCDRNGYCALMAEFRCVDPLTIWHAEFTVCEPNSCPRVVPPGVCCITDGSCAITLEARCAEGVWTPGGTCTTNPCPLPGACCSPNGTCLIRAAWQCVAPEEFFQGNATVCNPNPCVQPAGACCFANGTCQVRTRELCTEVGGIYQDDAAACTTTLCPQPSGACCSRTGSCAVLLSSVQCDGQWTIFGTCGPNPCALPRGSCCDLSGICTVTYARNCPTADSLRVWTADEPCAPNPCSPPGACCVPAGTCTVTNEASCTGTGTWIPDGLCAPNPCPQPPLGSCCSAADGLCTVTLEAACADSTHTTDIWTLSGTCTPNLCPPPSPGACCAPTGTCLVTPRAACQVTWILDGTCAPNPCPQPSGACCSAVGLCAVTPSPAQCDGQWAMFATCSPTNPCAQSRGSCCDPRGNCTLTYAGGCPASEGVWMADVAICVPNPCPPSSGACCAATGFCTVSPLSTCPEPELWRLEWLTCDPNPCVQPPQGACCAEDESCSVTPQADCVSPAIWRGELPSCEATSCPPMTPTQRMSWGRVKNLYR